VARADFAEEVKKYMHRWETGIAEDNEICEAQQAGLTSALRRPGPFALREPAVHRLNNWVLDQVLDGPGRGRAVPGP
jgi:phenylpropionate dioxygenase-like ring-hydroxylating dioxygenase large terminal subunit